jgi:hypothetical protein
MGACELCRNAALATGLAFALLISGAGVASATPPAPLNQLTHVQAQLETLQSSGDEKANAAIRSAAMELGSASRPSLWIDPNDAVPPEDGVRVYTASSLAISELTRIRTDMTVSQEALTAARAEILEAQLDLAENAQKQVGGPVTTGSPLTKWKTAYRELGRQITKAITSVPQATVEQASSNYLAHIEEDELFATPQPISGSPLTFEGKPELFYYGAEGCPFCAIERWSQMVALSLFGKFSTVGVTVSSTYDIDPATRTMTYPKSKYSSSYVAFVPVEGFTNQPGGSLKCHEETFPFWTTLQVPTAAQQEILNQYDSFEGCLAALPFMDIGNRWAMLGSSGNPEKLAGMSWQQIAGALFDPNSVVGQSLDGGAEVIVAEICELDGRQPARVCNSPVVTHYEEEIHRNFGRPPPPK